MQMQSTENFGDQVVGHLNNAKTQIGSKEDYVSIWWEFKGVIFYELQQSGVTTDSTLQCAQLMKSVSNQ